MSVIKLFSNRYSSCSFSLILTKLGTHDLCVNMQKGQIFEILILKYLQFFYILNLDLISGTA